MQRLLIILIGLSLLTIYYNKNNTASIALNEKTDTRATLKYDNVSELPNVMDYKYISIHCIAYNHLLGSALLR